MVKYEIVVQIFPMQCINCENSTTHAFCYKGVPSLVGLTTTIGTIAFIILGCTQPWFSQTIGIAGNPHYWQFWTLSSTMLIVGVSLFAYGILNNQTQDREQDLESYNHENQFTQLDLRDYYYGASVIYKYGHKSLVREPHEFIMEERYCDRKDIVVFNEKGKVCRKNQQPVAFAYSYALELKSASFDSTHLKLILYKFAEVSKEMSIPKLFIPTAAFPTLGIPHAILLIIELNPEDTSKVAITTIDPMGPDSGYGSFEKRLQKIAKKVFPNGIVKSNPITQQNDGWSCAIQMIENIELLSSPSIPDVQNFVMRGHLPVRTSDEMQSIYYNVYKKYAETGLAKYTGLVSQEDQEKVLKRLAIEGCLSNST